MANTIRIKRAGPRALYFDLARGAGQTPATGTVYETICRLEAGLSLLYQACQAPTSAVVYRDAETTSMRPTGRRGRVRLVGRLNDDHARELFQVANTAIMIHERPVAQRHTEMSGRLCGLRN